MIDVEDATGAATERAGPAERAAAPTPGRPARGRTLRDYGDLLSLAGLALLLPALVIVPLPLLRVPLGFVAVLFAPGYALVAAIFARRIDLDGVARAALSFGLSVAALPLFALVLNALPGGIRLWPMVTILSAWTLLFCAIGALRRHRLGEAQRGRAPSVNPRPWYRGQSRRKKVEYALGATVAGGMLVVAMAQLVGHASPPHLTEFYALGADSLAERYPREVAPGEPFDVRLGVTNREGGTRRYRIVVLAQGRQLAQTEWFTLANDATWEQAVPLSLAVTGDDQAITILLDAEGRASPYRQLRLVVNVRPHKAALPAQGQPSRVRSTFTRHTAQPWVACGSCVSREISLRTRWNPAPPSPA
jgi:uncharacterized membrane protein